MSRIDTPNLNHSIEEKTFDLLGDILLERETEELLAELEMDTATGNTAQMDAFFAAQDKCNAERIRKHFRRQKIKSFFTADVPKAFRAASMVIAVLAVAGSVAVATSHPVRQQVMKLLTQIEDEYTVLEMSGDKQASLDVPEEWLGESFMSYIPAGFEIDQVFCLGDIRCIDYHNKTTDSWLKFSEYDPGTVTQIDTEDAIIEQVFIHGQTAQYVVKNQACKLVWCDGSKYYMLSSQNVSREELFRVAEAIKKIY